MKRVSFVLFLLTALALFGSAQAATIDTMPGWNGTSNVGTFGYPDTATYGQTFTTPNGTDTTLASFALVVDLPSTTAFGAHLYQWDGAKATGSSLWDSPVYTPDSNSGFETATFTPGVNLNSALQYVFFISTSGVVGTGGGDVGRMPNSGVNPYTGGLFVFINNGQNASLWTSLNWTQNFCGAGCDLAFTAVFNPPNGGGGGGPGGDVPEPGTYLVVATGLVIMVDQSRKRKS